MHYKLETLEELSPRYFDPLIKESENFTYGYNFNGEKFRLKVPPNERFKSGFLQSFSAFIMVEDNFIPRVVINNLLSNPQILYSRDRTIYENLDRLWEKIVKRLVYESKGKLDLHRKNIINSIYGSWNFSPHVKNQIEKRTIIEIEKLNK